jgi:ATP-dependent DNA helicase RecQ
LGEIHSMNHSAAEILKQYWNYEAFRDRQEEIVLAVSQGHDTLAVLATGSGKSLCFQLPTLMIEGFCLVISPLVALMRDQVQSLRRKGITAFSIHSGMSRKDIIATFKLAATGNCRFLYVSPERLETDLFKEFLPALKVSLIAVDEAHCISHWGYDFRPPYLRIADIREELPGVPILALTASARPLIREDICQKLKMFSPRVFVQSFIRPNLSFSVHKTEAVDDKILDILQRLEGCSIIYCRHRRRTQEISDLLNAHGIPANPYHAGLTQEDRHEKQLAWMKNTFRVIVCTNAFGMGIDKADVRLVIHAELPDNLEDYYQEAGRAGRDGKKAYAVLLYNDKMLQTLGTLHKSQFPSVEYIQKIYQGLANYLQVPLGTHQVGYDFDLQDFTQKFSFQNKSAQAALQILKQEEFISLSDSVFSPATLFMTADRSRLDMLEKDHPVLEPLMKALLRTYAGIWDHPVAIYEKALASQLKISVEEVVQGLLGLHRLQVAEYTVQKETPQIYFTQPRCKSTDIRIDEKAYGYRKEQFIHRVQGMLAFVQTSVCRSVKMVSYFGEDNAEKCGICDNCVKEKREQLRPA